MTSLEPRESKDPGPHRSRTNLRFGSGDFSQLALFLLAYFVLEWLSFVQPVLQLGITPWNPQTGLALTFLLLQGRRGAFVVAAAAFLSALIVRNVEASNVAAIITSLWIAVVYALLAHFLRRAAKGAPVSTLVDSPASAARFVGASLVATFIVAAGFVAIILAMGALPQDVALGGVARYWVGDMNGILTMTPLLLWLPRWRQALSALRARWREALAQVIALVITMWLIFVVFAGDSLRFFYPLFVPMIWIALRWGVAGALLGTLVIQIGLAFALRDSGDAPPLLDLQVLMLTLNLTALLLGAAVNERERAQAQLRERDEALARAMRFATAGEMASALTHELNQPITALVSYLRAAQILADPNAGDSRLPDTLGKAANEAIRASAVLRRLRDFYRGEQAVRAPVNLAPLCAGVATAMQERQRRLGAQLLLHIPEGLPPVLADATQLEIVLHNLLVNALDAISTRERGSGRVDVFAERRENEVLVSVVDNGTGIEPEVAGGLFDPFVTSKVDGMGLGLAISRSLMRAQGGDLDFDERRPGGEGTRFIVRVPVS